MIPKDFVDKYLEKAKGANFFGEKIENLTMDELTACAVYGWERVAIYEDMLKKIKMKGIKNVL